MPPQRRLRAPSNLPLPLISGLPATPSLRQRARGARQTLLTALLSTEATITRNVVSHLLPRDLISLAQADSQIHGLLRGQAPGAAIQGLAVWAVDARCDETYRGGEILPDIGPCPNGFHNEVVLNICWKVKVPLEPIAGADHNSGYVCRPDGFALANAQRGPELRRMNANRVGVCGECERKAIIKHPRGWAGCQCPGALTHRYLCYHCRYDGYRQLTALGAQRLERLHHAYISRQGPVDRVIIDMDRPREALPRCKCGRKHTNHASATVRYCVACKELLVRRPDPLPGRTRYMRRNQGEMPEFQGLPQKRKRGEP